ncbi:hypothetical protein C8F04DRAFT_1177055 [Mycena alexandri]|uniref:Uncharacterized protein n=1 Tax=Mycena alexandri TaxID=1745969 RepID=A0AAD6XAS5_9AGAR|nr:hypothetical protein C8F04DRAFT_1177055 [Mycena alexandri]
MIVGSVGLPPEGGVEVEAWAPEENIEDAVAGVANADPGVEAEGTGMGVAATWMPEIRARGAGVRVCKDQEERINTKERMNEGEEMKRDAGAEWKRALALGHKHELEPVHDEWGHEDEHNEQKGHDERTEQAEHKHELEPVRDEWGHEHEDRVDPTPRILSYVLVSPSTPPAPPAFASTSSSSSPSTAPPPHPPSRGTRARPCPKKEGPKPSSRANLENPRTEKLQPTASASSATAKQEKVRKKKRQKPRTRFRKTQTNKPARERENPPHRRPTPTPRHTPPTPTPSARPTTTRGGSVRKRSAGTGGGGGECAGARGRLEGREGYEQRQRSRAHHALPRSSGGGRPTHSPTPPMDIPNLGDTPTPSVFSKTRLTSRNPLQNGATPQTRAPARGRASSAGEGEQREEGARGGRGWGWGWGALLKKEHIDIDTVGREGGIASAWTEHKTQKAKKQNAPPPPKQAKRAVRKEGRHSRGVASNDSIAHAAPSLPTKHSPTSTKAPAKMKGEISYNAPSLQTKTATPTHRGASRARHTKPRRGSGWWW